ncbi:MAG: arylsulfatase, partial [Mariniblastus sp.]
DWVRENGGDLDAMRQSEERVAPEFHQTTWASERAIEFISMDRPADQPWMLNINIYDPHPPFIPPKIYADQFDSSSMPGPYFRQSDLAHQAKLDRLDFQGEVCDPDGHDAKQMQANYYAMIAQIDDQFARILESLENTGQRENTVILFTSDHGESLGDHGLMRKGARFYEGLIRVPLIFSWPARFQQGLESPALVELLDMSHTLLELAGVDVPEYFQGQSLLPILEGIDSPERLRKFVRSEYFDALDPQFTGGSGTFATMYRTEKYKLSIYHDKDLGELYDLQEDPWEFEDLWDNPQYKDIKHQLIYESFNAHVVLTTDVGSKRIAPM